MAPPGPTRTPASAAQSRRAVAAHATRSAHAAWTAHAAHHAAASAEPVVPLRHGDVRCSAPFIQGVTGAWREVALPAVSAAAVLALRRIPGGVDRPSL